MCTMYIFCWRIFHPRHGWCWLPSAVAGSWVEIQIWTLPSNEDTEAAAAAAAVSPARTLASVCKLAPGPMASRRPTLIWISIKLWIINLHLLYISLYTTALLTGGIQKEGSARLIFNCADMRLFNFHDFKLWIMWILWSSVPGTGVCTAFCLN